MGRNAAFGLAFCKKLAQAKSHLRPRPTFAHTCVYGERVNAARYYVANNAAGENRVQSIANTGFF